MHRTAFVIMLLCSAGNSIDAAENLERRQWTIDGVAREALVYVPPAAKSTASPLVFAFHGHGGTMRKAAEMFAYHKHWPEAIAVYMQGLNTPGVLTDPEGKKPGWQRIGGDQNDRDLKFFDAVLAALKKEYQVDPQRIYSTGHSNGGAFTYLLWAARGDLFAAVAPCAAAGRRQLNEFKPKPVLHLAGEKDPLVLFTWQKETIDALRKLNGCEEGMPVGNGHMGSLVWTTPSALRLQINRVDVFAANSATTSFPRADSDYASGCGYVDINLVDASEDVFTGSAFRQHLSLYDGLMTAEGSGVIARVLAWPHGDVMAVEIEERRAQPAAVNIDLRMLRYQIQGVSRRNYELASSHAVMFQTAEHSATSQLDIRSGRILLTQQFREGDYHDASAVAIGVVGRQARARYLNEATVQLSAAPGQGRFAILISSAASFDPKQDVAALALEELEAAAAKGFHTLESETAAWWHDFWAKGCVFLHSADGQADFVEQNYTYFLYLMGASSRGKYPPRFGGMLWYTNGDMRRWGSQYWWANTNAYYSNLMPANRLELMDPMFSLYSGMYEPCAWAARQQWGSQGIWIPETVFFDGPERLPDDIAAELRDLCLARKPWEESSAKFRWFAETKNRHNSRWNFQADGKWDHGHYVVKYKGRGVFGHTTHILGAGTRIAALFWQRYQYTLDKDWLRDRAYPMIKGAAEFYRNFPNLQKGDDGKYHMHHVNNGEGSWNSSDPPYEVSCMHMIFPLAIRAAEILGVDADLRPLWKEIKDNLPPLRESAGRRGGAYGAFVYNGPGAIEPIGPEPELKRRFLGFNRLGSFIDSGGIGGAQIFRNRLRLREGPGAIDAEHIGGLTSGIHATMLSSAADTPEGEPVIQVFDAWPKDWQAAFTLLARGAFVVSSSVEQGKIEFVEIRCQAGGECRLRNPWSDAALTLYRNGKQAEDLSGPLLKLPTIKGEIIVVVPQGSAVPSPKKIL